LAGILQLGVDVTLMPVSPVWVIPVGLIAVANHH
jgi:hypothetical protein